MPERKRRSSTRKRPAAQYGAGDFGYPLNPEQQRAVTHPAGPLLIVAGAGTGKTTVITERIAWLIREGKAKPEEILALTFTEKAAAEMEERVDKLLPYGYVDLTIATFHAFGEQLLREHGLEIGLATDFHVLSTAQQWLLVREHLDAFSLTHYKPLGNPTKFLHALVAHFGRLKDEQITPAAYLAYGRKVRSRVRAKTGEQREEADRLLEVASAYATYERLLRQSGDLDFGDLILQSLRLLRERATIRSMLRNRYRALLVDEFQDTNLAQYALVQQLTHGRQSLTVVGDDDQSIYKFRGAALSNILEFKKDYPRSTEVLLTRNYRSPQNILDLAYGFIQRNNPNRLEAQLGARTLGTKGKALSTPISKKLVSGKRGEGEIVVRHLPTAEEEVRFVVADLLRRRNAGASWNDLAILVRANNQAEAFTQALTQQAIPHRFLAARGLYQQPEVLDLTSFLKLLHSYRESPALYRVLSLRTFGIAHRTVVDLLHLAHRKNLSLYEAAERVGTLEGVAAAEVAKVEKVLELITRYTKRTTLRSVGQLLYAFLMETKYIDGFNRETESSAILNIAAFYRAVRQFEEGRDDKSVAAFLKELDLILDAGADPAPSSAEEGPEAVKVMTIHSAKGLEFEHVYLVQCVDKRFPSVERSEPIAIPEPLIGEILTGGDAHLEEERRLFYVAITRAKQSLTVTYASDYGGVRAKKPSRFLYEAGLLQAEVAAAKQPALPLTVPAATEPAQPAGRVRYPLPAKFSFTQLKAFETCPKQYWYAHVLKIPVTGRHAFSFGKSVHATLRDFFELIQAGKKPTKRDLLRLYNEHWIDEWYDSKQHEQERKVAGKEALERFYDQEQDHFRTKPLFLEQAFTIKVGTSMLKGAIDRIDPLGGKKVAIVDYKTGSVPKGGKKNAIDQLVIYALAARDVLKLEPGQLSYHYLEESVATTREVTEQEMAETKEAVLALIQEIEHSDFTATPGFQCRSCDFREICEDRAL